MGASRSSGGKPRWRLPLLAGLALLGLAAALWWQLHGGRLLNLELSARELELVGDRFFRNECGGDPAKLTHWNRGERFISLGILHMLWYPDGVAQTYRETFPAFVRFCQAQDRAVPPWIVDALATGCPWPDRDGFYAQVDSELSRSLRHFLAATTGLQAAFAHRRLAEAFRPLLAQAGPLDQVPLAIKLLQLSRSAEGVFALIDYVNFKGEGIDPKERYRGEGWGLLQVLGEMPLTVSADRALKAFVEAAKTTLSRRVANAPDPAKEKRWLPGWHKRLDTYLESLDTFR